MTILNGLKDIWEKERIEMKRKFTGKVVNSTDTRFDDGSDFTLLEGKRARYDKTRQKEERRSRVW